MVFNRLVRHQQVAQAAAVVIVSSACLRGNNRADGEIQFAQPAGPSDRGASDTGSADAGPGAAGTSGGGTSDARDSGNCDPRKRDSGECDPTECAKAVHDAPLPRKTGRAQPGCAAVSGGATE